jgi:hypothetical protein
MLEKLSYHDLVFNGLAEVLDQPSSQFSIVVLFDGQYTVQWNAECVA